MRSLIRWAVDNSPAVNTLLIAVLLAGTACLFMLRRETFPEFELEIILVTVPYPGASPAEVEEGICQKVEEAVQTVTGIKKMTSVAQEGNGFVVIELESSVKDVQRVLNEIRSKIDRIPSFPELAEDPDVTQITFRQPAIRVAVLGPQSNDPQLERTLRDVAESVRDELLQLETVSQANLLGGKNYQVDIEIPEERLREHRLTLRQVAETVRRENIELPGGVMKTNAQEVLLRGKNKRLWGDEIAALPLLTQENGVVLTVGDLGVVRDEFDDNPLISRIDGRPAQVISIDRTSQEDLLAIVEQVKHFVATKSMPGGYELRTFLDQSVDVRERIHTLSNDGVQGLVLVFLVLAVFLELRLAFWVSMGMPVAILGSAIYLYLTGQTMNMLTMFGFMMALGIVVDDAIVIGDNIHEHRMRGASLRDAAIDGTIEVMPSILASVGTAIIAFMPMLFVSGVMGKFIAVLPVAVIATLVISVIETSLSIPCHVAHTENLFLTILGIILSPLRPLARLFDWLNRWTEERLELFAFRYYTPAVRWLLAHPGLVISISITTWLVTVSLVPAGITPWVLFPKLDSNVIQSQIAFPDGTPVAVTDAATRRIEEAMRELDRDYAFQGSHAVQLIYRQVGQVTELSAGPEASTTGSHVGLVEVELTSAGQRTIKSEQILADWRKRTGSIPGADSLTFAAFNYGPGGTPIEFKLLAPAGQMRQLEAAVEECKRKLATYPGVFDVNDDSRPGKWEFQLQVKDDARALGVTAADLAETVRASYYGEEVMRLQRGRHEVKLMVRYPREQRKSLADFEEVRVRLADGAERPLTELAEVRVERGYSEINRLDQMRSVTISADIDENRGNAREVVAALQADFMPGLLDQFPGIRVRWEGQQEQSNESMRSLLLGYLLALLGMFVLLTLEFRSYFQPLLVMIIIPFGFVGAVWGHAVLGLPITLFSVFGLVALTGVMVNDSIVLIDFINHRVREGASLHDAVIDAGRQRLRPILLNSSTTVIGLVPLLLDHSFQAQALIPMAVSMAFGQALSTTIVLLLMPTFYFVCVNFTQALSRWQQPASVVLEGQPFSEA